MPNTFWLKNKSIIVDASGHPILCDRCPCGNCPDFPAGSVLEMEVTHAIARTKTRLESSDVFMSVPYAGGTELSVTYEKKITIAFALAEPVPFLDPYPEWYRHGEVTGRVIFWRGEEYPALQPTVTVSVTGSASEWLRLDNSYEERAYYEPVRASSEDNGIYATRAKRNGVCEWTEFLAEGVLSGSYPNLRINATRNYEWRKTSGDYVALNQAALVKSGNWAENFTSTYSGVSVSTDTDNSEYLAPVVGIETISPYEGTASWDVSMRRESSYHREERSGAEEWLSTYDGTYSDVLRDAMTAHWLITPPEPLRCVNCGI